MDIKILVVDDEPDYRNLMAMHLRKKGYEVEITSDGISALEILKDSSNRFAVLVTDWMMPGISGNQLVLEAKKNDPMIEAIVVSAMGQMGLSAKLGCGAFDYLTKPLNSMKELSEMVERALIHRTKMIAKYSDRYGRL